MVGGKSTNTACVRFYVMHKLPRAWLSPQTSLPLELNGVPTDVIEAPPAYFAAIARPPACSAGRLDSQRPICPGISAANEAVLGGTLGAICASTVQGEERALYLLGNRHVFQDPTDGPGQRNRLLQPSPRDGGTAADAVATFARSAPIDESDQASNRVDGAIAMLSDGIQIDTKICRVGQVTGPGLAVHGMAVHKHGRSTGYSTGVVDDPSCDVVIPKSQAADSPAARFVSQIRIVPTADMSLFAQDGDSGSLIVDRLSQVAVGLLFACPLNGSYAYANQIGDVLSALQIRLMS
jgi:hypothetical protein